MGDKTGIEWANASWNPIVGCSLVSPGCKNCYAMKMAARIEAIDKAAGRVSHYAGTTATVNGTAVWTGKVALAPDNILYQPMRWTKPRKIFADSMGDIFHEAVTDEQIATIFAIMANCQQHTFQVLTKRPERMRNFLQGPEKTFFNMKPFCDLMTDLSAKYNGQVYPFPGWPLPNVWIGVSVEDQKRADERIPLLLETPAAVRFLSCEPLLGPVSLNHIPREPSLADRAIPGFDACCGFHWNALHGSQSVKCEGKIWYSEPGKFPKIDWVIAGGESGPGARPMDPAWARALRDECVEAEVPFFFKQWGEWAPDPDMPSELQEHYELLGQWSGTCRRMGKKKAGRQLDGRTWDEFPKGAAA